MSRINRGNPAEYHVTYTCRPAAFPCGLPERGSLTIIGLSRLDAEVRLAQVLRKAAKALHFILEINRGRAV